MYRSSAAMLVLLAMLACICAVEPFAQAQDFGPFAKEITDPVPFYKYDAGEKWVFGSESESRTKFGLTFFDIPLIQLYGAAIMDRTQRESLKARKNINPGVKRR